MEGTPHIYAYSFMAIQGGAISHNVGIALVSSEAQAHTVAMDTCKQYFPEQQGYYSHAIVLKQVPDELLIEQLTRLLTVKKEG